MLEIRSQKSCVRGGDTMTIKELYEEAKKLGLENNKLMFSDGYGIKEIAEVSYYSYQYVVVLRNYDDFNKKEQEW